MKFRIDSLKGLLILLLVAAINKVRAFSDVPK